MSINAGGVYSELVLDMSGFNNNIQDAGRQMNTFETSLGKIGKNMEKVGKELTMKVTLPIVGVGAAIVKTGMDFEAGMSEVQAISGATGEDLEKLEGRARELAKVTKFSATEAADGLKYMALAGWETQEMYDALPAVLNLAIAANMDLALASDIVTDTMSAFGMEAIEAGKASDIFAAAQSSSNTNVQQLGEAMKYAGAAANASNMDLEETSTILGILADSGIKGSMAGTTLTAMLRDLKKASEDGNVAIGETSIALYDAEGSMRDMGDILAEFNSATKDMTDAQRDAALSAIFGEQSLKGMNIVLATGTERYDELENSIRNSSGAAQEMADIMSDNLKGEWESLKSSLAEVGIQLAEILIPIMSNVVAKINEWVDWFGSLDKSTQGTVLAVAGVVAAIGPLLIIGGKLATGISAISGLFTAVSGGAAAAGTAAVAAGGGFSLAGAAASAGALLFNPWVLGAVAVAGAGLLIHDSLKKEVIPAMEEFDESISESTRNAITNFLDLKKKATTSLNQLAWSGARVTEEMKVSIVANTNEMADGVISKLEEQKIEGLKHLEEMLGRSTDMSAEEANEAIRIATEKYDKEIEKATEGKARIEEILQTALENNTKITDDERIEIEGIIESLKDNSIRLMSESQEEQEKILENLKANAERLSGDMILEIINNSKEQKEKTIEQAEKEYQERLRFAATLKKDGSAESTALADDVIKEAERQRDESIAAAKDMHEKVLAEVVAQGGDVVKQLDLDNARYRQTWDDLKDWFNKNPIIRWIKEVFEGSGEGGSSSSLGNYKPSTSQISPSRPPYAYASGTNFAPGGLSWVGEEGPELIDLPRGSKVYTNQKSMEMMGLDEEKLANAIIKGLKEEGLSKPAVIIMDNKAVGRGIVKVIDSELHTNNSENGIGKGVFT